jgi:glutamine cyclotransferase
MTRLYSQTARQTGRTTSLIESLKDGDRVCCATTEEARHLKRMCRDRGLQVTVITLPIRDAHRIFERGTSQGRTIFDHTWVERYYMAAVERAQDEIDQLQREASGWGAAHEKTRAQAREMARWDPIPPALKDL